MKNKLIERYKSNKSNWIVVNDPELEKFFKDAKLNIINWGKTPTSRILKYLSKVK